jgi:tetratricopeptide (TPR) repeat protein
LSRAGEAESAANCGPEIRLSKKAFSAVLAVAAMLALPPVPTTAQTLLDFGQTVSATAKANVDKARALRMGVNGQAADLRQSILILESVIKENPEYYRAWYNLGLAKLKAEPDNTAGFEAPLKKAIEIQESNTSIRDGSVYNTLGYGYLQNGDHKQAIDFLLKGLTVPGNSDWTSSALHYNLGRLYYETQDFSRAEHYLSISRDKYGNPAAGQLLDSISKLQKK